MPFNWRPGVDIQTRRLVVKRYAFIGVMPRSGIYVWAAQGDGRRFAAIFRATWKSVPLGVRRRLLKYWRDDPEEVRPVFSPNIQLLSNWAERGRYTFAACAMRGHELRFWAPLVDMMPPEIVRVGIAHELGHAYHRVAGLALERDDDCMPTGLTWLADAEEKSVEELASAWGFDGAVRDRWVTDHWEEVRAIAPKGEPDSVVRFTASGYEIVLFCPLCGHVLSSPTEPRCPKCGETI